MDFGNLLNFLNRNQKRLTFSFVLTLPIAYVYLYRFGQNIDANIIDFALTICIAMLFIAVNFMTFAIGVFISKEKITYHFSMLLIPQLVTVCVAQLYERPYITAVNTFLAFALVSLCCNALSILSLSFLKSGISNKNVKPHKKKSAKNQNN